MKEISFGEYPSEVNLGDIVNLQDQKQEVVKCIVSGKLMLNIDADQLRLGDLPFIKKLGLTISNPETEQPVALGEEYRTFGRKLSDWLDDSDDDDDSSFFSAGVGLGSIFGGSSSSGGFGGGFGGFGGGGFSGGGASSSF